MDDSNLLCIRFAFGVPLEDIFPPSGIHPRLKNLFNETIIALNNNPFPLSRIIKIREKPVNTGLNLKENLLSGQLYEKSIHPLTFFWIIRHFLGVLPLPLFAKYSNGRKFNWEFLAGQCRKHKMRASYQLDLEISWAIHRLPQAHIALIYALVNFFRTISLRRYSDKLDKTSVTSLVVYFSSSLFVRPYRPGFVNKAERIYFYLLFYLIVNWQRIKRKKCERFVILNSKLPSIVESDESDFLENTLIDFGCQTSFLSQSDNRVDREIQVPEEEDDESTITDTIYNTRESQKSEMCLQSVKEETEENAPNSDYEEISYEHSDTKICDKKTHLTPKILLREKLFRANRSLVNVIGKLKSKQDLIKSKSGSKLNYKYNLLKDPTITKVRSLHINNCVKESPNIKYKKLLTL
ncbi:uncharacterized protein LOC123007970 [Tribolium madens]|uniref:uncharacterized protein LOC123007970 n=1 Tax=Tribolium madens TaxID=41895 RepID=UPI001CF730A4|nr:uncharacterized protein LOC123007970 [Tribolium madens]